MDPREQAAEPLQIDRPEGLLATAMRKVVLGRALAILVEQDRVLLAEVGNTPVGPVILRAWRQAAEPGKLNEAIQGILGNVTAGRGRRKVAVVAGIPAQSGFFSTASVPSERKGKLSTDAALEIAMHSNVIDAAQLAADHIVHRHGGQALVSVGAARRELVQQVTEALRAQGFRKIQVEPAPCGLLRAVLRSAPGKKRLAIRVLAAADRGIAIATLGSRPLAWRAFAADGQSAFCAVRHLQTHCERGLSLGKPELVTLHGTAEWTASFRDLLGGVTDAGSSAALDEMTALLGLGMGGLKAEEEALDLGKCLRPTPTWRELVPWGEAAAAAASVFVAALFLGHRASNLERTVPVLQAENARHAWAKKLSEADLNKELTALKAEVQSVDGFLSSRIIWTEYLDELPGRIPAQAHLAFLRGENPLPDKKKAAGKGKGGRSLTMRGVAMFPADGKAPKEIDTFLDSLRGMPLLRRDFAAVELVSINWRKEGRSEEATFTVLCVPTAVSKKTATGGQQAPQKSEVEK